MFIFYKIINNNKIEMWNETKLTISRVFDCSIMYTPLYIRITHAQWIIGFSQFIWITWGKMEYCFTLSHNQQTLKVNFPMQSIKNIYSFHLYKKSIFIYSWGHRILTYSAWRKSWKYKTNTYNHNLHICLRINHGAKMFSILIKCK